MWLWCYEHACPWPLDSFFPRMMHKLCFAPRALRSGWFAHEVASTAACSKKAMFTPGGLIEISWPNFLQNTYHSHAWSCMRVCVKSWLWQMVANEIHCKRCQMDDAEGHLAFKAPVHRSGIACMAMRGSETDAFHLHACTLPDPKPGQRHQLLPQLSIASLPQGMPIHEIFSFAWQVVGTHGNAKR